MADCSLYFPLLDAVVFVVGGDGVLLPVWAVRAVLPGQIVAVPAWQNAALVAVNVVDVLSWVDSGVLPDAPERVS